MIGSIAGHLFGKRIVLIRTTTYGTIGGGDLRHETKGRAMRRVLLAVLFLLAVSGLTLSATAGADPGGPNLQQPVTLSCRGLPPVTVNPGTLTNQGRVAWAVDSTSVFVTSSLAFTDGTNTVVLYDSKKGLKNLITCTGDAGGGFTVIATGFFTPR